MTTLRDEDLLTPADAAEVLELSGDMVRLLARSGRLPTAARSVRGARLFRRDDVEQLAAERAGRLVCRHEVQFYESPEYLSQVVAEYLGQALALNARALVVAVPAHRTAFVRALSDAGHDVGRLQDDERLILLDARQTLSQFMVNGEPDPVRFRKSVGSVVERYATPFPKPRLHAYGEMVDLLWKDGAYTAAIELEELWNGLGRELPFSLLCGYSIGHFGPPDQEARFSRVCSAHSRVAPTERYQRHNSRNARLLEIASLQRQSVALEQERAAREEAENEVKRLRELVRMRDSEVTRSLQAREALLGRLSHELRDPLAPIVSTLELASMHQDPTRQEALIARQVKQLVKSIDGLIAEELPRTVAPQLASLDLAPPPPATTETEDSPPPRLLQTNCKVLIVDDNVDAAASLAEILEELGYAARMAHDAEGALALAKTFLPHIALLDIGLPGTSGFDLARMFKTQPETASTRLVAVTGYSRNADREKSRAAGCEAHLVKPVDLHALEKTLQRLMAGRSP